MIKANIIADSKNEFGNRITTFVVTFPRIILAEAKTHRVIKGLLEQVEVTESLGLNDDPMLSRNSASSRAIPFNKMLKMAVENPFIPIAWQKDHSGMQGTEYFTDPLEIRTRRNKWLNARDAAVNEAIELSELGVTKQLCNRLLEPFMWHTAIVTATELENFFALRCPKYNINGKYFRSKKDTAKTFNIEIHEENNFRDINEGQGDIHIMALAEAMWNAMNESTPKELKAGEWHIPFGDNILIPGLDGLENNTMKAVKIATARCARVSYMNFEGKDDYEVDIKLHDRLAASGHWSPFEHCARAMSEFEYAPYTLDVVPRENQGWSGNFKGFIQYRKMFVNENIQ